MNKRLFIKNEKKAASTVTEGCPCEKCDAKWVWRRADGEVVCPSFKKCGRYFRWFSEKWRAVTAPFKGGRKK
ncbi:MAG: hypothetical protein IKN50_01010 [Clostridia bacterium]|nr:hypothetical protein [Clostridia bacterium]